MKEREEGNGRKRQMEVRCQRKRNRKKGVSKKWNGGELAILKGLLIFFLSCRICFKKKLQQ